MSASKNGCAKQTFVNERQLFHGTNPEIVEAICKQNFDWRLHGKNATKYGQGSYFAVNSSYSNAYAKKDHNSSKFMFVAKVLVGSYAAGDSSYRRPPRKDPSNPASDLYDSCVDDESFPTIFVVFDTDQFYPEYIIEYSVDSQTAQQPVATRVSAPVTKWVHGGYQQPVATQVPGGYQQPAATQVPAPKVRVAPAAASKPQVTQTHTSGSSSPHRAAQVPGGYQQPVATQVPGGYQQPVATQVPASKARVAPAAASKPQVTQTHTSGSSTRHQAAQVSSGYQQLVATQVPASKARVAPAAASKPQVTQTRTTGSPTRYHKPESSIAQTKHRGSKGKSKCSIM